VTVRNVTPAARSSEPRQTLLKQAALAEALMDGLDVGIMACDEHGRLSLVNRVGRDLHGFDVGDTIEPGAMADSFVVYRPGSRERVPADALPLLRALNGEVVDGQEVVLAPPGRPRRLVSCTGRRIQDEDGAVLGAVIGLRDVTSQRAIEAALSARAEREAPAGLPNRVLLDRRTDLRLGEDAGGSRSVALLFVDLDGFASVNDTQGHAVGNHVLRQAARRLDDVVRATDTSARLGGDSFAVMCPDMPAGDPTHAERLATRIAGELGRPFYITGAAVQLSASIGIAHSRDEDLDAEELVARAEAAMLTAKQTGAGQIATYSPTATALVRRPPAAARIERLLRTSIEDGSLDVHYQPVVNLSSGATVGVEALARLTDDEGTAVAPTTFVQVAEQCGLVGALGEQVLRRAAMQVAQWKRQLLREQEFGLGVNLSVHQLSDPGLFASVESVLDEAALDPEALVLELTESVFSDIEQHTDVLRELQRLGLKLAIDDFGSGYSSLSYLRRFDVDILKIDQTFVADLDDKRDRQVTGAIVRMAHGLGMPVIAEGIETPQQLAALRELGCQLGQGNLLAPAASAATIGDLIARRRLIVS